MFCSACGSEISLAAEACPACGRAIATAPVRVGVGAAHVGESDARLTHIDIASASAGSSFASAPLLQPGSIHAGDLDLPGFPRTLAGRVALLTGLVMLADLLLPWVNVNNEGYSPTRIGLPALGMVLLLIVVVAPPLIPRLRRAPLTRALPLLIGALTLGFASALWLIAGPLAPLLARSLIGRISYEAAPGLAGVLTGDTSSILQITPAIGLYLFILGACALIGAGYQTLMAPQE